MGRGAGRWPQLDWTSASGIEVDIGERRRINGVWKRGRGVNCSSCWRGLTRGAAGAHRAR